MQRVIEWLRRCRDLRPESAVHHRVFRVLLPGKTPTGFRDTIVKLEPLSPAAMRPGATDPTTISAIRFIDSLPVSLGQAMLAADLGALLALASDRRIEVALELPMTVEGRPTQITFLPLGSVLDRRARGPMPSTLKEDFLALLRCVSAMDEKNAATLGAAIQLHYAALILAEQDPRAAYILVVASLEVLSRAYGKPATEWKEWERSPALDKVFAGIGLTDTQAQAIRDELMRDRQLRLKATFRSYVRENLPPSFLTGKWTEWQYNVKVVDGKGDWEEQVPIEHDMSEIIPDPSVLDGALAKRYDLRSGMVHAGEESRFFELAVKPGMPLTARAPVPYAILRQMLRVLILEELPRRCPAKDLPDIRLP